MCLFQVSDIHVSRYRDFDRAPDLVKFCEDQLSIIKPDFVIASGKVHIIAYLNLEPLDLMSQCPYSDDAVEHRQRFPPTLNHSFILRQYTVDSRYLELGYLEFCVTRSIYLNQKCKLICTSGNLNL